MNAGKVMDHAEYQKRVRAATAESLEYTIRDARQALAAMPDGPNASYYQDEICYCADELQRRRTRGLRDDKVWHMNVVDTADRLVSRLMGTCEPDESAARARLLEALANENVQQVIVQAVTEVVLP